MASPKLIAFSPEENRLAELAKALGHPARIAILKELAHRNSCVCGEIVEVLPLAQSTVSQHLKELKEAGLIKSTVEGAKILLLHQLGNGAGAAKHDRCICKKQ